MRQKERNAVVLGNQHWRSLAFCLLSAVVVFDALPNAAIAGESRSTQTKSTKKKKRKPSEPPGYRQMRDAWHESPDAGASTNFADSSPKPHIRPLVIKPVHQQATFTLIPDDEAGHFSESELRKVALAFSPSPGVEHPIEPRLLELIYRGAEHFNVPWVHLISGYRLTRSTSRHTQGRAADMVFPGVSDEALATYLRSLGFVGVGIYPRSGFVHFDVRDESFFWIDRSPPSKNKTKGHHKYKGRKYRHGRRRRVHQTLAGLGKHYDELARARGEKPIGESSSASHLDDEPETDSN
jgi:uncharacterized protein YcbK (DUF882 family)